MFGLSNSTTKKPTLRRLQRSDFPLLLRAQAECPHQLDAMTEYEVHCALFEGGIDGLVLEEGFDWTLLCWQREGKTAMLTCLYRSGGKPLKLSAAKMLVERAEGILREFGVKQVFLGVAISLRYNTLLKVYGRFGFEPDMVRMTKEL